jgi:hypothetical protein
VKRDQPLILASIVTGIIFLGMIAYVNKERIIAGRTDFAQLYAGASLVGTPDLYSARANDAIISRVTGVTMEGVTYSRLPFYAWLLKPFTWLPYRTAYYSFVLLNVGAALVFIFRFSSICRELPLFCAFSVPLLVAFAQGQDTPILLLLASTVFLLAQRGRDFAAGLVLSLCAIKFHLFTMLALAVIVHKRWRLLAGGVTGGLALLVLSFAAAGPDWPAAYLNLATSGYLDPCPACMPNVKGMSVLIPSLEWPITAAVVILFLVLAWRISDFYTVFALALIAGLLLSLHAYPQDTVLLLLSFAIIISRSADKLLRTIMALAITPPMHLLLLAREPYSAAVPAAYIAVLAAAYRSVQSSSASERLT